MTGRESLHRRDRDGDRANVVAAIDDLAALVRPDINAVAWFRDRLLAAGDDRELTRQNVIDFLRRRGIRPRAAAGEEVRDAEDQRLRPAHLSAEHAERFISAMVRRLVGF